MLEFVFLGTGGAAQIPVWGCTCNACQRATKDATKQRKPASAMLTTPSGNTLVDAGRTDLAELFAPSDIQRILLTHFHMDHVQGLFHLRWGNIDHAIPLFRPDDPKGCDDLYKHPGCLAFQTPLTAFECVEFDLFTATPVPLQHSKPTFGYVIQAKSTRLAYLTDTSGIADETADFLNQTPLDILILDCAEPPRKERPRNHNDLNEALRIVQRLQPKQTFLTHISHKLENWLDENPGSLPTNVTLAYDGMRIPLN